MRCDACAQKRRHLATCDQPVPINKRTNQRTNERTNEWDLRIYDQLLRPAIIVDHFSVQLPSNCDEKKKIGQLHAKFYFDFWNEVPYTRVEQGTYSTESETLPRQRNVTMLSRSFLGCRYAWIALSRSYLRWTNIPKARWQCVRYKREAQYSLPVYSHILALTYDAGSNFNDPCLRADIWHRFNIQRPMFTTYWFQLVAFRKILNPFLRIWYYLAISFTTKFESQKSD